MGLAGRDVTAGAARAAGPGRIGRADLALLLAVPVLLVQALLLATPAPVSIDEFLYLAMADAMAERGSFALVNGGMQGAWPDLTFFLSSVHPGGLMAQYPGGWAYVAAPFYALGGIRGLLLLNALATLATLWLIRFAGRELTGDARTGAWAALIYLFATYAIDYSAAIWPHALTLACIAAAMAGAAAGWRRDAPAGFLAAGLALGLAVNLRADAVLIVPPVALWLMAVTLRPWRSLGAFLAGLAPGYAAATAVNIAKFGIASPLSYGRTSGTYLSSFSALYPLVGLCALFALSLALPAVRRRVLHPRGLLALAAVVLAAVLLVPPLRDLGWRLAHGFGLLVIDIQQLAQPGRDPGVVRLDDGTLRIYGLMKKSLLQSLPWAAGLIVLLPGLWRGPQRAAQALCWLIVAAVLVPFSMLDWFGGMANNMRYLLAICPALSILGALMLRRLAAEPRGGRALALAAFAVPLLAGLAAAWVRGYGPAFTLQYTVPNAVVAATAMLAVLALAARGGLRPPALSALSGALAAGLATAFVSGWVLDQVSHQAVRQNYRAMAEGIRAFPPDSLIYARPEFLYERVNDPDTLIGGQISPGLLDLAFSEGRPVYVESEALARKMVARGAAGRTEIAIDGPWQQIWRVFPAGPVR